MTAASKRASWMIDTVYDHPGCILGVRTIHADTCARAALVRGIRICVGSWANHNAPAGEVDGHLVVGQAETPNAHWENIGVLADRVRAGRSDVRIYIPKEYTTDLGRKALYVWDRDVNERPYDKRGLYELFRVSIKSFFILTRTDNIPAINDWEWAWWCTEGCGHAWTQTLDHYAYGKPDDRSTPKTQEKRAEDGSWVEIHQSPTTGAHPCASLPFVAPAYC